MLVRAYAYILSLGREGLRAMAEDAVLNANYVRARLRGIYDLPYDRPLHARVRLSDDYSRRAGVRRSTSPSGLIDYGFHPPTVYFPLIVTAR